MNWFKAFSYDDPCLKQIVDEFGHLGYGQFLHIFEHCLKSDCWDIDEILLCRILKINRRTSSKIFPIFLESLDKVSRSFQKFPKLDASNKLGSTRAKIRIEESRVEERKEKNKKENIVQIHKAAPSKIKNHPPGSYVEYGFLCIPNDDGSITTMELD